MEHIVISDSEFEGAKTREGLQRLLNRVFAEVKTAFWKESHPTIIWMVVESIPFLKAVDTFLETKPHLKTPEFIAAVFLLKGRLPNVSPLDILEQAAAQFEAVAGALAEGEPEDNGSAEEAPGAGALDAETVGGQSEGGSTSDNAD